MNKRGLTMIKTRIPIDEDRFLELMATKVIFSEIREAYLTIIGDPEDLGLKVAEIMETYADIFNNKG